MTEAEKSRICGIVMPIGAMPPEYEASHWLDVRKVLNQAIESAGFQPQIVSESFENDVIQSRIIQNLYDNAVVVCDVSGLNPNVMFELGIRITFNKPVIAVTDDFESLPFDTKMIEHLKYPKDLHIHQTNKFIDELAKKIKILDEKFCNGKYKTPLDALGSFEVFTPSTEEVSGEKYIADGIDAIIRRLSSLERRSYSGTPTRRSVSGNLNSSVTIHVSCKEKVNDKVMDNIIENVSGVRSIALAEGGKKLEIDLVRGPFDSIDLFNEVEKELGGVEIVSMSLD